jgi:hypothetical protein
MVQVNTGAAQSAAPSAWGVYFPSDAYSPQDRRVQLIQELLTSLGTDAGWQLLSNGLRTVQHLTACVVALDYEQLLQHCDSANLSAALEMQPTEGLLCLQAAVHEVSKHHSYVQVAQEACVHPLRKAFSHASASCRNLLQPHFTCVRCNRSAGMCFTNPCRPCVTRLHVIAAKQSTAQVRPEAMGCSPLCSEQHELLS